MMQYAFFPLCNFAINIYTFNFADFQMNHKESMQYFSVTVIQHLSSSPTVGENIVYLEWVCWS